MCERPDRRGLRRDAIGERAVDSELRSRGHIRQFQDVGCIRVIPCAVASKVLTYHLVISGEGFWGLIHEEMFERCEQIGPEPSFFLAHSIEIAALQQQCEEALREIFRIFRFNALSA